MPQQNQSILKTLCARDLPSGHLSELVSKKYSIQTSAPREQSGRLGAADVKRAACKGGAVLVVQEAGRPERGGVKA